jgi:hypothetical protein
MTSEDEVMLRAQTIKEVSDIMGEEIAPNAENVKEAEDLARKIVENPGMKQEYGLYANETVAYLGGLVGSYNHMIVKDLADLKLYVVNKLVEIVHHEDSNLKEQITALRSIGEVDGVDAFKKKTEVIHKNLSLDDIEEKLRTLVGKIEKRIQQKEPDMVDAEIISETKTNV